MMDIDFTKLNALSQNSALRDFEDETDSETRPKEAVESQETSNKLQIQADKNKDLKEQYQAVYDEYQVNTQIAQTTMNEITLGVKHGTNIYILFLQATKVIAKLTNDKAFESQINEDIRAIYGIGLEEHQALEIELTDTKRRLESLQEAKGKASRDESRRIDTAIKAHKKRIHQIEHMMKN